MPNTLSNGNISEPLKSTECEDYCASEITCWGCIKTCNNTCHLKAVKNCDHTNSENDLVNQISSRKPGKTFPICVCWNHYWNLIVFLSFIPYFDSLFRYSTKCWWTNPIRRPWRPYQSCNIEMEAGSMLESKFFYKWWHIPVSGCIHGALLPWARDSYISVF